MLRCIPALRDFAYAHNQLGRCHAELEDWDLAVAAQERCLALKPDFGYAWMELARGREQLGESSKAVAAYEQAAVLLPDNPWLKRSLAILKISASLKAGETQSAADQIQSLLGSGQVNEDLLQQWLDSVATLATCGEWSEVIQLARAIHQGEQLAGHPTSLGTRCPLLFLALALLIAVDGSQRLNPSELAGALLETRWLPASTLEKKLWQTVFTDLLATAVTRIVVALPEDQILSDCGVLLLAIADVADMIYRDPELARSLLQAGIQLRGMPDEDQLRLRESSGLLTFKSAGECDTSSAHPSLVSDLSQKELWKLLDRVAPDDHQLTEAEKNDRHLIWELVDKSGQLDQFKRVKDLLGKGRYFEALQDFEAIREEHCSSRVLLAANLCKLSLSGLHLPQDLLCLREVSRQLLQYFRKQPRSTRMRRDLEEALWRLNTRIYQDTEALSRRFGPIERVQHFRSQCLELLTELTTGCLNLPGLPPSLTRKKSSVRWLFIASKDLPQCFLYRVEQKRQQLESLYCDVEIIYIQELNTWCIANKLLLADRLVVCRLPGNYAVLRVIELAHRFGVEVLYDIDDLIFDAENFPPPLSSYGGTISESVHAGLAMDAPAFMAAMKQADRLIFSTPTLARRWQDMHSDLSKPVHVLPNLAPPELLRAGINASSRLEQHHQEPLRLLVSSGTLAHKQVWEEELAPALQEILQRYPEIQLDLVGSVLWPDHLQEIELSSRIRSVPFSEYPSYLNHLKRAHIGLAPLEPGIVTDAKSAIKWMEYSMLGLASVVSPTATYRDDLSEGENVLFASDREGWVSAMDRLISDKSLRVEMAKRAHDHAKDLFGPGVGEQFWTDLRQISSAQNDSLAAEQAAVCRKILVINCFFAPQSVGGATRVAQDRVLELVGMGRDNVEVTVLCVELDPWQGPSGALGMPLDIHHWHGARVVRLGAQNKPWDWHHDGDVERFCREWFELEAFDEIEAHAMQILTAAPLRVALEQGIPYRVVLHDGWWLSQLQFLTRSDGTAVDPAEPLSDIDPNADDTEKSASLERRRDLFEILAGAQERLAVSEAFAELHRRAGLMDVGVRVNRVPTQATNRRRVPGCSQRGSEQWVRICMIGGMAVHKGYPVFRAALQQAGLTDKVLVTVIDHLLQEDDPSYELSWEETPVRFMPPVPMDCMDQFYAAQDVLVAPSIWPESFGLVTREALNAGLWVIASDIGALAEPIEQGRNGFKVAPNDIGALAEALKASVQHLLDQVPQHAVNEVLDE